MRVIFCAAQAALLSRPKRKQDRTFRSLSQSSIRSRDFQNDTATRGIIDHAVVNCIAVDGKRNTKMIPVGAVQHVLLKQLAVAALDHAENIAALDFSDLRLQIGADG